VRDIKFAEYWYPANLKTGYWISGLLKKIIVRSAARYQGAASFRRYWDWLLIIIWKMSSGVDP